MPLWHKYFPNGNCWYICCWLCGTRESINVDRSVAPLPWYIGVICDYALLESIIKDYLKYEEHEGVLLGNWILRQRVESFRTRRYGFVVVSTAKIRVFLIFRQRQEILSNSTISTLMHTFGPSPGAAALIGFEAQLFTLKAPQSHLPTSSPLIEVAHVDARDMRLLHISMTMQVY